MMQPQEIEVWYVLPAIRMELCRALSEKLSQKEIAKLLGITEPAVSQYIKGKRGSKIKLSPEIQAEVKVLAEKLQRCEINSVAAINYLSELVFNSNAMCQIHALMDENVPEGCRACMQSFKKNAKA